MIRDTATPQPSPPTRGCSCSAMVTGRDSSPGLTGTCHRATLDAERSGELRSGGGMPRR